MKSDPKKPNGAAPPTATPTPVPVSVEAAIAVFRRLVDAQFGAIIQAGVPTNLIVDVLADLAGSIVAGIADPRARAAELLRHMRATRRTCDVRCSASSPRSRDAVLGPARFER